MNCKTCKNELPESEFYWNKTKSKYENSCKSCMRQKRKQRYKKDPAKELSRNKKYTDKNKDKVNEYKKQWARDNKDQRTVYAKNKYQNDPIYRLKSCLRSRLTQAVSKKYGSTMELVGCSIDNLIQHLESQFMEGMTWDNYGEWHVDHIRPCASFDLSCVKQQRECFHYTNLQPLWRKDNQDKGDKFIG